jgi:mannose-1-phosphate guanylyltransferase/mannose-6-phosphate isomerase
VNLAVSAATYDTDYIRLNHSDWKKIRAESIDYAVLEKAINLSVVMFSSHWSDLGSWPTLAREVSNQTNQKEPNSNVVFGNVVEISTKNCLLWSNEPQMVLSAIGLDGIVAIAMPDAVLVANIEHTHEIRNLVEKLKSEQKTQAEQHSRDYRPWGWFECLIKADGYQVKRLCVYPGERLSLQSHQHRSEHWIAIVGFATVEIDEKKFILNENQSTYIECGKKHRLSNETDEPIFLIEVQTGSYLGEDDIVRFDDIYNRVPY